MKFTPRPYQLEAIYAPYHYWANGGVGNPIITMPTGTGKSVVIAGFCKWVLENWPMQRILILTHVKELVGQNYQKLASMAPELDIGINSAGLNKRQYHHPVIFCGIQSVARQAHKFGHIDLVIIDECHRVGLSPTSYYRRFLNDLTTINPMLKVIGLTATDYNLGRGKMAGEEGGLFDAVCYDLCETDKFNQLFAEGYLTRIVPQSTKLKFDLDGVSKRGGEYVESQLQQAVSRDDTTIKAVEECLAHKDTRRCWLVFCTGVEHAEDTAFLLNQYGIKAKAVHGNLSPAERDSILDEFNRGELQAVTNNNVLTTGYDNPNIDLIVGLRPTLSPALWVQMLGRGTRCVYEAGFDLSTAEGRLAAIANGPKPDCLVLDFAANSINMGPINNPYIPKKAGSGGGDAIMKECDACGKYIHASVKICPYCGYEHEFESKLKNGVCTKELIEEAMPIVEDLEVTHITYCEHNKKGAAPALKVNYHCGPQGLTIVNDYFSFEHQHNFPVRQARSKWRQRSPDGTPPPSTTAEAIRKFSSLKNPTHIRVHTNRPYPEILEYCYDGSNFGKQEPCSKVINVQQTTQIPKYYKKRRK